MNQKKIANLGLFAAVAIIFGYVESLIPFFAGIPGMKLGLANLAVLFILEKYTWKEAALVSPIDGEVSERFPCHIISGSLLLQV